MRKKKEAKIELEIEPEEAEEAEKKKEDMKSTNTAFILMFPALILAGVAGLYAPSIYGKLLVIALAIYQFLMFKKFIQDYYRR